MTEVHDVAALIARYNFRFNNEATLQDAIETVLRDNALPFEREVIIGPNGRLDFLVHPGIAVEVKIDGSLPELTRQVFRYTQNPRIGSILIVTSRLRLMGVVEEINGKPIASLYLRSGLSS